MSNPKCVFEFKRVEIASKRTKSLQDSEETKYENGTSKSDGMKTGNYDNRGKTRTLWNGKDYKENVGSKDLRKPNLNDGHQIGLQKIDESNKDSVNSHVTSNNVINKDVELNNVLNKDVELNDVPNGEGGPSDVLNDVLNGDVVYPNDVRKGDVELSDDLNGDVVYPTDVLISKVETNNVLSSKEDTNNVLNGDGMTQNDVLIDDGTSENGTTQKDVLNSEEELDDVLNLGEENCVPNEGGEVNNVPNGVEEINDAQITEEKLIDVDEKLKDEEVNSAQIGDDKPNDVLNDTLHGNEESNDAISSNDLEVNLGHMDVIVASESEGERNTQEIQNEQDSTETQQRQNELQENSMDTRQRHNEKQENSMETQQRHNEQQENNQQRHNEVQENSMDTQLGHNERYNSMDAQQRHNEKPENSIEDNNEQYNSMETQPGHNEQEDHEVKKVLANIENICEKDVTLVFPPVVVEEVETGADNLAYIDDSGTMVTITEGGEKGDNSIIPHHREKSGNLSAPRLEYSVESPSPWGKKLRAGIVVFCGFWICFFAMGVTFSMGTFLPEWLDEFKEGRAKTALVQSVLVGILFGAGIVVGIVIDRYGIRLTILTGSLVACCGLIGAVFCPGTTSLMISVGVLVGVGFSGCQLAAIVGVTLTCRRSAGLALGVVTAGGGTGSSVLPYIIQFLIDRYGWRGAFYILAGLSLQPMVFALLMTSVITQVIARRPHTNHKVTKVADQLKVICRPRFMLTCCASFMGFATCNGFVFIILDYAAMTKQDGVFFLVVTTIVSTVFRLVFGALNMVSCLKSYILLTVSVVMSGVSIVLLGSVREFVSTLVLLVVMGLNYGGLIGIFGTVVLDMVGQRSFSVALGISSTVNGTASSLGGLFYGLLYDLTGSYQLPCTILGIMSCVLGTFPVIGYFCEKCQRRNSTNKESI